MDDSPGAVLVLEQCLSPLQGPGPWLCLAAQEESSSASPALDPRLGLSCARRDHSELPTLEEGLLPSAEVSPGAPAPASPLGMFQVLTATQFVFYCSVHP